MKKFEVRNGNFETSAVVKNQGTKQREQRTLRDCWQWKAKRREALFVSPQRMEFHRNTEWMTRGDPRPTSSFSSVASRLQGEGPGQRKKDITSRFSPSEESRQSKVARLEAALQALGQEQSPAKTALMEALKMAKEDVPKPVHPQQRYAEASARVERLETDLKVLGEEDPDAKPLKAAVKQARIHARLRPVGERLDLCLQYIARVKKQVEQRNRSETPWKSRGRWRRSWPSGCWIWRVLCGEASQQPRIHQDPSAPSRVMEVGPSEEITKIEGASGRALGSTRIAPRRRVNSPQESANNGWHRYRARFRWTERIRSHVDVDRRSPFHFEGSWERCPVIRTLCGWRGVRISQASNPGPPRNVRRVPRASQRSGASTFPAVSREVRAVLRGVPGSDPTVVDMSGSSDARSGNRFAPLSEGSAVNMRAEGVKGADVWY